MHEVDKPEHLNTSSLRLYNLFFKPVFSEQELLSGSSWIDVRDVAEAHAAALEKEAAGDERILISSTPPVPNQEFIESAKRAAASLGITGIQEGVKNYDPAKATPGWKFSSAKRDRVLGIKINPVDDMVRDSLVDFKERGWIPA